MAILFVKRFLVLLSLSYITSEKLNNDVIIKLRDGKIRGHILKSENGNDYYAFQEIPYAKPPVGENRFQLPKKVESWSGVLNATKNTKICYQEVCKYPNLEISEDCLYINVYTPVKPNSDSERLPVLVWIHGGWYRAESSTFEYYGPKYIMDHGVVVVTFNYRLGPFGFGTTEDDTIPSNIGLKDQKFALEWVNENIHSFAGDSEKVTIVGESAGSFSVGLHVLGVKNKGKDLFRAAIMQSGSPLGGIVQNNAREKLFDCGRKLDSRFASNSSNDLLKVLQKSSAQAILTTCSEASGTVIENEGDFSHEPLQSLIDGNFKKVPILMGFNSEEFIWAAITPDMNLVASLDRDPSQLIPSLINISPANRSIAGELLRRVYTKTTLVEDIGGYCRWNSDHIMITPVCKHADLAASRSPIYLYQFSYSGKLGQGPGALIPGAGRVAHAEDLHYMWDDGTNSDLSKFSEIDQVTLHRFVRMWTNFVKYLNPTPKKDHMLDNMIWPTTDIGTLRYLNFNDTLELKEDPRNCKEVQKILDYYMEPPYRYYGVLQSS